MLCDHSFSDLIRIHGKHVFCGDSREPSGISAIFSGIDIDVKAYKVGERRLWRVGLDGTQDGQVRSRETSTHPTVSNMHVGLQSR